MTVGDERDQITNNVHKVSSDIYIPCLKTYLDLLGNENEYTDTAEVFFEFAALHKSRGTELRQRPDPVRVYRTSPISDVLLDIAIGDYDKNKTLNVSTAIKLVFGATDPELFESVMTPQLSVFEKAITIKDDCGERANIIIISNDPAIIEHRDNAEKERGKKFTDGDFVIVDTVKWLNDALDQKTPEVENVMLSVLRKKKKLNLGKYQIKWSGG